MRDGIVSGDLDPGLKYATPIAAAANLCDVSAFILYAIACNETILGEYGGKWDAATIVSPDDGHGLFQLTSSWPEAWMDPLVNAAYAARNFVAPAWAYWQQKYSLVATDLARAIFASFNAGIGGAERGHAIGDVDAYTTDHYAARALAIYSQLVAGTFRPLGSGRPNDAPLVPPKLTPVRAFKLT